MQYLNKLTKKATLKKKAADSILGGMWQKEISALQNLINSFEDFYDTETNQYALNKKQEGSYNYEPATLAKMKEIEEKLRELLPDIKKINDIVSFEEKDFETKDGF